MTTPPLRLFYWALLGAVLFLSSCATVPTSGWLAAPYRHVAELLDPAQPRMVPRLWEGRSPLMWAFASGECGQEEWGQGIDRDLFARANVEAFVRARRPYMISTGGEVGVFTCGSDAGMARFVERYDSRMLVGIDFDIEGKQTPEQIRALAQRARFVADRWPHLRLSFTLATFAGSDESARSLNATGETVMKAIREAGLDRAVINLMVMNYGPADPASCVVSGRGEAARCDMARSAIQAAHNLHRHHRVPYERIALTMMLGENDVADNVMSLPAFVSVVREARAMGLAGVHHWSVDRDQPCAAGDPRVSPRCHGLPDVPPGRFTAALLESAER